MHPGAKKINEEEFINNLIKEINIFLDDNAHSKDLFSETSQLLSRLNFIFFQDKDSIVIDSLEDINYEKSLFFKKLKALDEKQRKEGIKRYLQDTILSIKKKNEKTISHWAVPKHRLNNISIIFFKSLNDEYINQLTDNFKTYQDSNQVHALKKILKEIRFKLNLDLDEIESFNKEFDSQPQSKLDDSTPNDRTPITDLTPAVSTGHTPKVLSPSITPSLTQNPRELEIQEDEISFDPQIIWNNELANSGNIDKLHDEETEYKNISKDQTTKNFEKNDDQDVNRNKLSDKDIEQIRSQFPIKPGHQHNAGDKTNELGNTPELSTFPTSQISRPSTPKPPEKDRSKEQNISNFQTPQKDKGDEKKQDEALASISIDNTPPKNQDVLGGKTPPVTDQRVPLFEYEEKDRSKEQNISNFQTPQKNKGDEKKQDEVLANISTDNTPLKNQDVLGGRTPPLTDQRVPLFRDDEEKIDSNNNSIISNPGKINISDVISQLINRLPHIIQQLKSDEKQNFEKIADRLVEDLNNPEIHREYHGFDRRPKIEKFIDILQGMSKQEQQKLLEKYIPLATRDLLTNPKKIGVGVKVFVRGLIECLPKDNVNQHILKDLKDNSNIKPEGIADLLDLINKINYQNKINQAVLKNFLDENAGLFNDLSKLGNQRYLDPQNKAEVKKKLETFLKKIKDIAESVSDDPLKNKILKFKRIVQTQLANLNNNQKVDLANLFQKWQELNKEVLDVIGVDNSNSNKPSPLINPGNFFHNHMQTFMDIAKYHSENDKEELDQLRSSYNEAIKKLPAIIQELEIIKKHPDAQKVKDELDELSKLLSDFIASAQDPDKQIDEDKLSEVIEMVISLSESFQPSFDFEDISDKKDSSDRLDLNQNKHDNQAVNDQINYNNNDIGPTLFDEFNELSPDSQKDNPFLFIPSSPSDDKKYEEDRVKLRDRMRNLVNKTKPGFQVALADESDTDSDLEDIKPPKPNTDSDSSADDKYEDDSDVEDKKRNSDNKKPPKPSSDSSSDNEYPDDFESYSSDQDKYQDDFYVDDDSDLEDRKSNSDDKTKIPEAPPFIEPAVVIPEPPGPPPVVPEPVVVIPEPPGPPPVVPEPVVVIPEPPGPPPVVPKPDQKDDTEKKRIKSYDLKRDDDINNRDPIVLTPKKPPAIKISGDDSYVDEFSMEKLKRDLNSTYNYSSNREEEFTLVNEREIKRLDLNVHYRGKVNVVDDKNYQHRLKVKTKVKFNDQTKARQKPEYITSIMDSIRTLKILETKECRIKRKNPKEVLFLAFHFRLHDIRSYLDPKIEEKIREANPQELVKGCFDILEKINSLRKESIQKISELLLKTPGIKDMASLSADERIVAEYAINNFAASELLNDSFLAASPDANFKPSSS
jgi:flagellin-specific chaperone FliS